MCGMAGIVSLGAAIPPPSRAALARMAGALVHRGPDEQGLYRDARAGLAHARLSIIDRDGGRQPLADIDGTAWIVFNGEIFNYVELRAELTALGHRFRTRSDTEVVVQAWRAWGEAAFERLKGQWALALWVPAERRLVLCRDRTGICPLYLCEHGGRLLFASEVKAIFAADPAIPRALDAAGLDQTFTLWTSVAPQGVFAGVGELAPGHMRVYRDGAMRERCFWQPQFPLGDDGFKGSLDEAVEMVRAALDEAVSLRMVRSDVPVGSYLSGGLDSSLVAAMARRFAGDRFQTFSLRFADAEYDETAYQRLMVRRTGSEHHELVVARGDIAEVFPDVVSHGERPILRTSPAPLFLLSRMVRQAGIKVVLTGEGADEVFAGYDLFREAKVRRFWARQPDSAWRWRLIERLYPYLSRSPVQHRAMARQFFGHGLAGSAMPGFGLEPRWRTTAALRRLFSADMRAAVADADAVSDLVRSLPPAFMQWGPLAQDQYLEMRTLLSGYLLSAQGDRMLMAHSIEGRFPFLDEEVMAVANALPARHKLRVLDEKHVLKRVAAPLVPPEIVARKKQPYRTPNALCFFGADAPDYVADLLSETSLRDANLFDPAAVARLVAKCRIHADRRDGDLSNSDNMALVGVLSTQLLHHRFVAGRPGAEPLPALATDIDRLRHAEVFA